MVVSVNSAQSAFIHCLLRPQWLQSLGLENNNDSSRLTSSTRRRSLRWWVGVWGLGVEVLPIAWDKYLVLYLQLDWGLGTRDSGIHGLLSCDTVTCDSVYNITLDTDTVQCRHHCPCHHRRFELVDVAVWHLQFFPAVWSLQLQLRGLGLPRTAWVLAWTSDLQNDWDLW